MNENRFADDEIAELVARGTIFQLAHDKRISHEDYRIIFDILYRAKEKKKWKWVELKLNHIQKNS